MGETKYRDAGDILIKIIKLKYVEFFIQTSKKLSTFRTRTAVYRYLDPYGTLKVSVRYVHTYSTTALVSRVFNYF